MRYFIFLAMLWVGCDKEHRQKCEWYLVPDVDRANYTEEDQKKQNIGKLDEGFIPVCARNYVVNKQDCRLQAPLDFAKSAYNRKFKLVDLQVKAYGLPRTITEIKFCE
jgi:hypothetical protein